MATSLVKQATSVAEQFIPRQINTNSQSSLQGLQTGNVYADRTPSKYALLANALSDFSSTLEQSKTNELKRNQQEDLDLAKQAIAGETIEGLATRSAIQIMSDRGLASLGTGVTEAYIDKQRGRAIVATANQQFQTYMTTQQLPKTNEEYLSKYNNYIKEFYGGVEDNITNKTAFDEGYYEAFTVNQKAVLEEFDKRKLKDNREFATGVLDSNISTSILSWDGNNKKDIIDTLKQSLETFKFTAQTDTTTNAKVYNDSLRRYVEAGILTGEDIKKVTSELVIGNDYYNGSPLYLDKNTGIDNLVTLADNTSSQSKTLHNYTVVQDATKLSSPEEFMRYLDSIKFTKPLDYKTLEKQASNIVNNINTRITKENNLRNNAILQTWNSKVSTTILQTALEAELSGKTGYINTQGAVVPISNLQVEYRDSQGVLKSRSATVGEKSAVVQQYIANSYANKNLSVSERSERILKVLSTGVGKDYAESYRQQATNGFAMIKENSDGTVTLPKTVSDILELRANNTALFCATMGEKVNAQASALVRLTEVFGGQKDALKYFARANGVKQDNPSLYNEVRNNMETKSANMTIAVTALDGSNISTLVSALSYTGLKSNLIDTATIIEVGSKNGEGLQLATKEFSEHYTAYNKSSLLPKEIFSGIQAGDQYLMAGKMVIDSLIKGSPEDATVVYNASQQALYINDKKVALKDLNGLYQKLMADAEKAPKGNLEVTNLDEPISKAVADWNVDEMLQRMVD